MRSCWLGAKETQQCYHLRCLCGAHQAVDFLAITQQDQGGPQPDAKSSPQRTARTIFNTQVVEAGKSFQGLGNTWFCALAVATPVHAKLQEKITGARV